MNRADVIKGLRDLADWLEANDGVPMDGSWEFNTFTQFGPAADPHAEVDRVAEIAGVTPETTRAYGHYVAAKRFGPVTYKTVFIPEPAATEVA